VPRYKPQYRTAAENALHHCCRNAFQAAREAGVNSIAYAILQASKSFPKVDAAHVAVRTFLLTRSFILLFVCSFGELFSLSFFF